MKLFSIYLAFSILLLPLDNQMLDEIQFLFIEVFQKISEGRIMEL